MATEEQLRTARRLMQALEPRQCQDALVAQAQDCWPIVEALGYYDLADHLKAMRQTGAASPYTPRGELVAEMRALLVSHPDRPVVAIREFRQRHPAMSFAEARDVFRQAQGRA
jgi:hypothetical protein